MPKEIKSLLFIDHIEVENTNAISGMVYGFPAISHFLGFSHALSRQLYQMKQLTLGGCAVICHSRQVHAQAVDEYWGDKRFSLTRNPVNKTGETASFNEEGRMHMTVSLVIECDFYPDNFEETKKDFCDMMKELIYLRRLAGGTIKNIRKVELGSIPVGAEDAKKFIKKHLYRLLPGFSLVERSALLVKHLETLKNKKIEATTLDALLDFYTQSYQAGITTPLENDPTPNENTKAEWIYIPNAEKGYFVPIMSGYRAVSSLYAAGQVKNIRDPNVPARFVENIYTLGQWISLHRIQDFNQLLWHYDSTEAGWYLCKNAYE